MTYSLEGFEQELKFFTIDPVTGKLNTVSSLPSSNRNLRITVNVSDGGDMPLSVDCDVFITLFQFNDTVDIVLMIDIDQFDKELFETLLMNELKVEIVVVNVTMLNNGLVHTHYII